MNALLERTIGELVAERPSRSRLFESHGIDYCCGGKRSLREAASQAGIDVESFLSSLEALPVVTQDRDWRDASMKELIGHILTAHHDWLKENLPRIAQLSSKVARVHGDHAPETVEAGRLFDELMQEMVPHLEKEEKILFPAALHLESTGMVQLGCHAMDSLEGPVGVMEREHLVVGALLEGLVKATDGFRPPEHACNTWRALYDALQELDRNTRAHVHLENEVLHARIRALQA
ncbi:MAG: iron-sulfur cluster repair di-iron protein [Fibrobacterota bacterium]